MEIKKLKQDITFLEPVFKDNYCAICFSSSEYYVPYLTVAINSLIQNSNSNTNYDIVVFTQNISETNQEIIKRNYEKENVSIRFYKVNDIFEGTNIHIPTHIETVTIETYYRILVPFIMKKYNKVLFLDSDMMILSDVNELYKTDISQYALAATHEILFEASHIEACYNFSYQKLPEKERKSSAKKQGVQNAFNHVSSLGVQDIKEYFQAGLILYNCDYFNEHNFVETLFENIQKKDYEIVDQDALNELCYKKVLILNGKWNFTPLNQGKFFENMLEENQKTQLAIKDPKIIHFVGPKMKPWNLHNGYYHTLWWKYARKTPYYETILTRLQLETIKQNSKAIFMPIYFNVANFKKNILKYWKYKFFKNFVFGKTREQYKTKKTYYKNLINDAKETFKEYNS